ncbi:Asp_protease_2 domain-containing protein [Cephalotus follicularis]|uniref:Asp_protease_2 domain-containing protein n=1 Tax=Cephalotus follicularis TaxID=3775 RepID=A0A1Q3BFV0_CEPFO|nr:Asp_protease_2 domain-containing protein [Cephalotus follicularis]
MYVCLMIKGQQVAAIVDTGVTHSSLAERIVHRLDLKVDKHTSRIKAVNSQAQVVTVMAQSIKISMGDWEGKIDLMVVPLDDFDFILGSGFFISAKIIIIHHLCGLLVMNEQKPCFLAGYNAATGGLDKGKRRAETLSTMQMARGLKKGCLTYLTSLVEVESETIDDVPEEVAKILVKFQDTMPSELLTGLPPRRGVDHKIETVIGARPPLRPLIACLQRSWLNYVNNLLIYLMLVRFSLLRHLMSHPVSQQHI